MTWVRAGNRRDVINDVYVVVDGLVRAAIFGRFFLLPAATSLSLITAALQGAFLRNRSLRSLIKFTQIRSCRSWGSPVTCSCIISRRRMGVVSLVSF